jgi:hypothetical protein
VARPLDRDRQIRLFTKLKLAICARAGNRAGFFCALKSLDWFEPRCRTRIAMSAAACSFHTKLQTASVVTRDRVQNMLLDMPDAELGQLPIRTGGEPSVDA